ncbi:MAG: restriction endonuclease subunit S [Nitrosomonadales bacterium]|nr:restriction endonuclease subunit S [Nitrosomonadales bacterium]
MKFAAYKSYKPSGSDWLPRIPAHWNSNRLRHLLSERLQYGANESAELDDPELPRYVRITDIDEHDSLRDETFRSLPEEVAKPYLLEDGDVLFARSGATSGKTFLYRSAWGRCAYAGYLIRARLEQRKLLPSFLRYFTASSNYWQWLSSSCIQATIQNVSAEKYADLWLPVPPIKEQQTITNFLDAQTAKIDTLLAKKRQLIDTLKEERSALIARAVTRGLPPEAAQAAGLEPHPAMKDSGFAWLGDIPFHWQAIALKRIVAIPITDGPHETPEFAPEGVPFASVEAVWDGKVHLSSVRGYISEDDHMYYGRKYLPQRNDIFIVKSGSTTGKIAIVDFDDEFNVWSPLAAVRCNLIKACPHFIFHALCSEYFQGLIQVSWSFGTQPNIGMGVLGNLNVALPPLQEQQAIAAYLDRETARIDQLTAKVEAAIDRLTEYRQALITSAVTGKIDVRRAAA